LGYAILGLAFNRGFFDIILPAALIYSSCSSIPLLSDIVKDNLKKKKKKKRAILAAFAARLSFWQFSPPPCS
jgi:hypothetical protein